MFNFLGRRVKRLLRAKTKQQNQQGTLHRLFYASFAYLLCIMLPLVCSVLGLISNINVRKQPGDHNTWYQAGMYCVRCLCSLDKWFLLCVCFERCGVILFIYFFFYYTSNIKAYNNRLLKTLPTIYYTTLQERCREEQIIMSTPWD